MAQLDSVSTACFTGPMRTGDCVQLDFGDGHRVGFLTEAIWVRSFGGYAPGWRIQLGPNTTIDRPEADLTVLAEAVGTNA